MAQVPDAVWINKPEGYPEECGEIILGSVDASIREGQRASGVGEREGACALRRGSTFVGAAEDDVRGGEVSVLRH